MTNQRPFALRSLLCAASLFALTALPFAAHAQTATATLSGTVEDEKGAVVPGVVVAVLNIDTLFRRETTTNDSGSYVFTLLPPGHYSLTAERQGFKIMQVPDITVNVGDQKSLKIQLQTGNIAETVRITGEAPLLDELPAVATTVDRQFVANLPLNGRSFQSLITLSPGVVLSATNPNGNEPGQFSVNGQRSNANYFSVDGVSANVSVGGGLISGEQTGGTLPALTAAGGTNNLVSVDALQEFKIQTSTYAAEFGRTPGGQISIATRSGTSKFHGTLFDYFRNDVFDANDWFNNATRQPKPATRQHDFGGVLGGPLFLPRFGEGGPAWFNGKDRTFFFFSYEGLRLRQPQAATVLVPSLAARQAAPASTRPLLDAFPRPNGPENAATKLAPLSASFSNPYTFDAASVRVDHTVNSRITLFGRYNHAPSETVQRGGSGVSTLNTLTAVKSTTQTLTLGSTSIITPNLNNEFRFNYSRVTGSSTFTLDDFGGAIVPPDSYFFPSFASRENSVFNLLLSSIGPGSLMNLGHLTDNLQRQINLVDNVSFVSGTHAFKFGVDYRRLMPVIAPRTYAQVNIANNVDQLLLGRTNITQVQAESVIREPIFNNLSMYGQDTWRVHRRLTLTYGLRWEFNPVPHEKNGNGPRTVTGFDDPATTVLAPAGTPLYRSDWKNFAPRIGFSYQLRERAGRETILRGGFGVFYDLGNGESASAFAAGRFPYASTKSLIAPTFPLTPANAAPAPFSSTPSSSSIVAFDTNFELPYTLQYSFAVEQSLGANQTLSASYVGARGRRLLRADAFARAPLFSSVTVIRNSATSDYDSLQIQFQRRLSRGLQALVAYTFGKSLDTASSESTTFPSAVLMDPRQNRGPSDFDVRHIFSGAISYNIRAPQTGSVGNAILHGWWVEAIVRGQSSPVVNITTGTTFLGSSTIARPDLAEGVPLYVDDPLAPGGRRINRNAFLPVPLVGGAPTRQGSLGRNALRGLPLFQTDLTMRRQFSLTEQVKLQFRTDFFNIFNHPNFGSVCSSLSTCTDATFGRATRMFGKSLGAGGVSTGFNPLYQIGGPRSMQFSLKLEF
jgi:hypothetical protein